MIPNYAMISSYSMINQSMDFDNRKVYGDTSITDGLVVCLLHLNLYSCLFVCSGGMCAQIGTGPS